MTEGIEAISILVIDDNPQMREIVTTVLRGAGIRRVGASSTAVRGLELVKTAHPDVIYVDYEMPGMNGLDFVSEVRALGTPDRFTPVIMLTGHSDLKRITAARDRGVTEFVAKPVLVRTILQRLQSVILTPRPFVRAPGYFGPERRRRNDQSYKGPRRRAVDSARVI